jgi:hypothetical protein
MDFSQLSQFLNPNAPQGLSPEDFQGQQLSALKQRKLANALREQLKNNPVEGNRMVGGRLITPHWSEGLLNGLRTGMADYQGMQADTQDASLLQAQQAAATKWRSSLPQSVPANPGVMGADGMGPPAGVAPEQPITREAILKHTLSGMTNPLTAQEAGVVNQSLTSDLTRGEDMKYRDQQARAAAQDRSDNLIATLVQRADDAARRSEDRGADRASREAAAAEALALRREIAKGQQALTAQGLEIRKAVAEGKSTPPEKPLPSGLATSYVNNQTALGNLTDALKHVETNPDAFGLSNMLPNAMVTRMDPKGVAARAAVFNLGSLKIHDRSGAAVTASETPRLLPFIPTPGDGAKTIKTKLAGFQREYKLMQQDIEDFAQAQGYKSPSGRGNSDIIDFGGLK